MHEQFPIDQQGFAGPIMRLRSFDRSGGVVSDHEAFLEYLRFVDRGWIWPLVRTWQDGDKSHLAIGGEPGSGKTVIAREWFQQSQSDVSEEWLRNSVAAAYFCDANNNVTIDLATFVMSISEQLADNVEGFRLLRDEIIADRRSQQSTTRITGNVQSASNSGLATGVYIENLSLIDRDFDLTFARQLLMDLVLTPLRRRPSPGRPILLIDALDESRTWASSLTIEGLVLNELVHDGILRVVATSRDIPREIAEQHAVIDLSRHRPESIADVERYVLSIHGHEPEEARRSRPRATETSCTPATRHRRTATRPSPACRRA
jgi:hypothetical protein